MSGLNIYSALLGSKQESPRIRSLQEELADPKSGMQKIHQFVEAQRPSVDWFPLDEIDWSAWEPRYQGYPFFTQNEYWYFGYRSWLPDYGNFFPRCVPVEGGYYLRNRTFQELCWKVVELFWWLLPVGALFSLLLFAVCVK